MLFINTTMGQIYDAVLRKVTIANQTRRSAGERESGKHAYWLDCDNLRTTVWFVILCREYFQCTGENATLFSETGVMTFLFILPCIGTDCDAVRKRHEDSVDTPFPRYEAFLRFPAIGSQEKRDSRWGFILWICVSPEDRPKRIAEADLHLKVLITATGKYTLT